MTPEQFAYWLQGYAEVCGKLPTEEQWSMIKDHLQTVFKKITPSYLSGGCGPSTALELRGGNGTKYCGRASTQGGGGC